MARPIRILLLAAMALFGSVLLAACGSSSSGSESAAQLLAQTFGPQAATQSANVTADVRVNLAGIKDSPGPVTFKLYGPFQDKGKNVLPDFDLTMYLAAGAQSYSTGIVAAGGNAYLQFGTTAYELTPSLYKSFKKSYFGSDKTSGANTTLGTLGIHPQKWLVDPVKVGTTNVGGVSTVHLTARVDVTRFTQDINSVLASSSKLGAKSSAATAAAQRAFARSITASKVDVYTGASDHVLRNLTVSLALAVAPADRKVLGGMTGGTVSIEFLLSGINEHQTISAPANPQPLSAGLAGLGAGSGSASSSGATGSTGPSISAPQPYLNCVKRANGNISAIQKCASLLDG
jgi:hypothetical protein